MSRIFSLIVIAIISLAILSPTSVTGKTTVNYMASSSVSTSDKTVAINHALQWLIRNQYSNGSYGAFYDHLTAAAAYALWLNNSQSQEARRAYTLLAQTIDNSSAWFWGPYGEADVPGMVLYSLGISRNTGMLSHLNNVTSNLYQFHESNGGFFGYYSTTAGMSVTSSVDTALALRGLISASNANSTIVQSAVNYLFTLQNPDGSFNLTSTTSYDALYYQGPGKVSITGLVLLALKDAAVNNSDLRIIKALDFLTNASNHNFPTNLDNATVLSASYSLLAFNAYNRLSDASNVRSWIISHQNVTGGYVREGYSPHTPNAYDTAWAAIALEQPEIQPVQQTPVQQPALSTIDIIASLLGIGVVAVGLVFLLRWKRLSTRLPVTPTG